jgi:hypothetical protein
MTAPQEEPPQPTARLETARLVLRQEGDPAL